MQNFSFERGFLQVRKFFFAFLITALLIVPSFGAEQQQDLTSDYITQIQTEISRDISRIRESVSKELEGLALSSSDIARRINELAELTQKSSDDMSAWGYTEEQRELHTQTLSQLSVAYSAYSALLQGNVFGSEAPETIDVSTLGDDTSPDITTADDLRREITKVSRRLDVQLFYVQSKINKLKIDLAEASNLRKRLEEAETGNTAIELPRTYVLRFELAKINVALSQLQVRSLRNAFDQNVAAIQRLRRRLDRILPTIIFPQEVLDAQLEAIQATINERTEEMSKARKSLDSANAALIRARAAMTSQDADQLTTASTNYMVRTARVNYWEYTVSLLEEEISYMRENQQLWRDRYKLFHDQAGGDEIWKLRNDSEARIKELQRQLESIRTMEANVLRQVEATQKQSAAEGLSGVVAQNLIQAAENQRRIISEVLNRYESLIPEAVFYQQRLYSEANDNLSTLRVVEKVGSFSKETVMNFLNTELWQGEGYSVTVQKLVIAVLVFLSSFFLSSWGSHWIKRRMINRFKASITAANAVQRISFYILWIAFALIALNIVKIPLTAFAFMGGAVAVGIGFGMQNIFNNLISGFIVIFSRPFKVNDIVDVAGVQGVVEDIGSRATTIKTWDGFDVMVPNKYLLENSVTNWTKSDMRKREILKVGVAYGSDSRQVEKLLLDVVKGHTAVLKDPAPFVIFKNFGDSALEYEIYYWIELRKASGLKVSSDMRHHITAVFEREGISIPYPQRDIHIIADKQKPHTENA